MRKFLPILLLLAVGVFGQPPPGGTKNLQYDQQGNILPLTVGGHVLNLPVNSTVNGVPIGTGGASGPGSGTVTSVSVVNQNGVSGSVANSSTQPAITLSLGAITPSSVNGITLAASGAAPISLTIAGVASVSGANTGDQTNIAGNAATATKLAASRTINGVGFDGSANITVPFTGVVPYTQGGTGLTTFGTALQVIRMNALGNAIEWGTGGGSGTGDFFGPPSSIDNGLVLFDQLTGKVGKSPNIVWSPGPTPGPTPFVLSGTNTGDQANISGNAATATVLQTTRNINGVGFNGSAAITVPAAAATLTGPSPVPVLVGGTGLTALAGTGLQVLRTNAGKTAMEWAAAGDASTGSNLDQFANVTQASTITSLDLVGSGAITLNGTSSLSGLNTGDQSTITGNAGTATKLATATTINGVSFDGSATTYTLPAAGSTLTDTVTVAKGGTGLTGFGTNPLYVLRVKSDLSGLEYGAPGAGAATLGANTFLGSQTLSSSGTQNANLIFAGTTETATAWTTNGLRIQGGTGMTLTDSSSSGTVATAYTNVLGGETISSTTPTTFTDYYSLFVRDPVADPLKVTLPGPFALGANSLRILGNAAFSGSIGMGGHVEATLSADVNNWDPTGAGTTNFVALRLDSTVANANINGLAGGLGSSRILTIVNIGTTNTITLKDQVVSGNTASNRFALGGSDIVLRPSQSILLRYDAQTQRWRPTTNPMVALNQINRTPVLPTKASNVITGVGGGSYIFVDCAVSNNCVNAASGITRVAISGTADAADQTNFEIKFASDLTYPFTFTIPASIRLGAASSASTTTIVIPEASTHEFSFHYDGTNLILADSVVVPGSANVTGIRKSTGSGTTDTAAVVNVDYAKPSSATITGGTTGSPTAWSAGTTEVRESGTTPGLTATVYATLPAANSFAAGTAIRYIDSITTGSFGRVFQALGADTLNGVTGTPGRLGPFIAGATGTNGSKFATFVTNGATSGGAWTLLGNGDINFVQDATDATKKLTFDMTAPTGNVAMTVPASNFTGVVPNSAGGDTTKYIYDYDSSGNALRTSPPTAEIAVGAFQVLTDAATVVWNVDTSLTRQKGIITLGGNRTLQISQGGSVNVASNGMEFDLEVIQDGAGNRQLTLPTNSFTPSDGQGTIYISTAPNTMTKLKFIFDGNRFIFDTPMLNLTAIGGAPPTCTTSADVGATTGGANTTIAVGDASGRKWISFGTFTASTGYTACSIDVLLTKVISPVDNLTFYIYTDSGGLPGVQVGPTGTTPIASSSLSTTEATYTLPGLTAVLTSGSVYHVVAVTDRSTFDGTNYVNIGTRSGQTGKSTYKSALGATWTLVTSPSNGRFTIWR